MARSKPYDRQGSRSNPDGPGRWTHDLAPSSSSSSSLAARLSGGPSSSTSYGNGSSSKPSLLSRISGGAGKELLPSNGSSSKGKMAADSPLASNRAPNSGRELLPPQRQAKGSKILEARPGERNLAQNGINAALGLGGGGSRRERLPREHVVGGREKVGGGGVSIFGAARGSLWVRVENLAQGTTADDVMSAFAPAPILSANVSSDPAAALISVDVEVPTRADAEGVIQKYNGVVADGNTLKVGLVRPGLAERLSQSGQSAPQRTFKSLDPPLPHAQPTPAPRERELVAAPSTGKMYSDQILRSDPSAGIITLAVESKQRDAASTRRADAWLVGGPGETMRTVSNGSLSSRIGGRGRGQIGGGSYADMLVD